MRLVPWVLVAVVATGTVRHAEAQPGPLAPVGGPPQSRSQPELDYRPLGEPPPEPTATPVRTRADRPPNVLGPPVMGAPVRPIDREPVAAPSPPPTPTPVARDGPREPSTNPIRPAGGVDAAPAPARRAALGAPELAGAPVPARSVEPAARTAYTPTDEDPVNDLLTTRSGGRRGGGRYPTEPRSSEKFGDKIGDAVNGIGDRLGDRHDWFRSDHAFDGFISPVTNPFLFEDPRSLTEVRPIFMYQSVPSSNSTFQGGNLWYFGTQARVAFTERLSFTFNKLGGLAFNPANNAYSDSTGFAELWLGPKYTILRGEQTGSLVAAGVQFQVPVGTAKVYQDTGSLSVVPYLTYGQNFGKEFRVGSFNSLIGTGYSIATDKQRSDYYWLSAHLDLDVMNNHRFYPLAELNWFYYTKNGSAQAFKGEGRDLINFGSQAKGTGLVTGALGARFKITESAQIGAAFEIPFGGARDLFKYRATVDFILRY